MEEDIKILERMCDEIINLDDTNLFENLAPREIAVKINGLINRVKELEKENKELMNLANNKQWISPCYVAHNYIPKSKIREKKEEYNNQSLTVCLSGRSQCKTFKQAVQSEVIKILQELLEDK